MLGRFRCQMAHLRFGALIVISAVSTSGFSPTNLFSSKTKISTFLAPSLSRNCIHVRRRESRVNPCFSPIMRESGGYPKEFRDEHQMIQDFLTQRSIQTLMHNMKLVGDTPNLEFLESFMDHQGLSNFHGYGGLRTDSATYINALQRSVPVVVVKRKKYYRGGSPNNPYVTDNEISFSTTIVPRTLAANIISMREILAKEWMEDLSLIADENAELLRHHEEMVRNREDRKMMLLPPRHEDSDDNSPLRLASYDLLEKLATDIAAQRVAESLLRGPAADRHAGRWLREQYILAGTAFQGDHGDDIGRKFMLHLLGAMPVIVSDSAAGAAGAAGAAFVDPLDLAQRVMAERERAAAIWLEGLRGTAGHHAQWTAQLLESCLVREAPRAAVAAAEELVVKKWLESAAGVQMRRRKKYRLYLFLFPSAACPSSAAAGGVEGDLPSGR